VSGLNELIYECPRSLEAIGHARMGLQARPWVSVRGGPHFLSARMPGEGTPSVS
jgi:hypothetical protein